jgi:hypothetical protein
VVATQVTLFVGAAVVPTAHAVHVVLTVQVEHLTGQATHVSVPEGVESYLPAAQFALTGLKTHSTNNIAKIMLFISQISQIF